MLVGQTGSRRHVDQVVRLPQVALRLTESDPGPGLQGRMCVLGCRGQNLRVPLLGVFRSKSRQRVVAGHQRVGQRLRQRNGVAGRRPVMRQRGRPFGRDSRALFDGFGHPAMESSPPRRAQPVVESPLNERVGEGESMVDLRQHSGPERNVEVVDTAVDVDASGGGHQVGLKLPADDRRGGQDPINLLPQGEGAVTEEVAHADGKPVRPESTSGQPVAVGSDGDHTGLGKVPQHLSDEKGIAIGLRHQGVAQGQAVAIQLMAGHPLHELQDLGAVQSGELDPVHPALPVQPDQKIGQGIRRCRLFTSKRRHEDDTNGFLGTHHPPQERDTRRVGPVQVIEHDDQGILHRCLGQGLQDGLVQHGAFGRPVFARPGAATTEQGSQRLGQLGRYQRAVDQWRQCLGPGLVRQFQLVVAATVENG